LRNGNENGWPVNDGAGHGHEPSVLVIQIADGRGFEVGDAHEFQNFQCAAFGDRGVATAKPEEWHRDIFGDCERGKQVGVGKKKSKATVPPGPRARLGHGQHIHAEDFQASTFGTLDHTEDIQNPFAIMAAKSPEAGGSEARGEFARGGAVGAGEGEVFATKGEHRSRKNVPPIRRGINQEIVSKGTPFGFFKSCWMGGGGGSSVRAVSYRVFARKYRPQTFAEVIGQDHITRTLRNAVASNRIAQAYLFVGPRGIGKTSTARILAKALNCAKGPTPDPCGKCDACLEIAEGRNLDVVEIDGASNNGVENIRDLREKAAYSPASGQFKIYLIDEVHMLSTGAFNALLKTLEEPPPHVKFIFATTEAHKVPATITSRCQRFDLRRIPAELIAQHLLHIAKEEKVELEPAAADSLARGADGGLRDAESMLDQMVAFCGEKIGAGDVMDVFGFTPRETVEGLAAAVFAQDANTALDIVAAQSDAGKDLSRLASDLVGTLRDALVAGAKGGGGPVPQGKLLDLVEHFSAAESSMKWVSDKKLQFDVALIKAVHILDEASLTEVIETLSGLCDGSAAPVVRAAKPAAVVPPAPAQKPAEAPKPQAPAPAAKTEVLEKPAAPAGDAASVWASIASEFAGSSVIRFGWLKDGIFEGEAGGALVVRFPGSSREQAGSVFMEQGAKDMESRLLKQLGRPLKLRFEFDDSLVVGEAPPPVEQPAAREEAPPPEPPKDPLEEFLNDPLIEKALEIFKGTLQTRAP